MLSKQYRCNKIVMIFQLGNSFIGFQSGYQLAQLLQRRTGMVWEPVPASGSTCIGLQTVISRDYWTEWEGKIGGKTKAYNSYLEYSAQFQYLLSTPAEVRQSTPILGYCCNCGLQLRVLALYSWKTATSQFIVNLFYFRFSGRMLRQTTNLELDPHKRKDLKKSAHRLSQNLASFKVTEGGLSGVTREVILNFITFCEHAKELTQIPQDWLPSITNFEELVYSEPLLRLNWETGIEKSGSTLQRYSGRQVVDIMDSAVKLGPKFSHSELVGFPLNSIFIEFMQTPNGRAFFSCEKVNHAFKHILNDYGAMLDTKESLRYMNAQPGGWFSPEANALIDYQQYDCDPHLPHYGFANWNQWFLRKFKSGQRPLRQGTPPNVHPQNVIVSACESTPLSSPSQPCKNVKVSDKFWLKDSCYSLSDMLGGRKLKKQEVAVQFQGGTVYQAFLSALNYHRWHSPVEGVVQDIYSIEGTYLLDQSQFLRDFDEGSPNNSQPFLTAVATRQVFLINAANPRIGRLAIIFIGMAEVSSCVATVQVGQKVEQGEEIGHFAYGGSSHTIIFQKKARLRWSDGLYESSDEVQGSSDGVQGSEGGKRKGCQQRLNSYLAHVE